MKGVEEIDAEEKGLHGAAIIYALVLLVALFIGLYGLFSLFWLATSAAEHSAQAIRWLP